MAYLTLFGWSFLAATILPLGSEPALVFLVRDGYPIAPLLFVATAGNYFGACTTFALGRFARQRTAAALPVSQRQQRALRLINRYGAPAMLLSWVPLIGDVLVAAAGAVGMPFKAFSVWTIAGKAARYAAVAWTAGWIK
ncbi:MAG: VTT domain-containing protein [Vicinamibacterales bacterium]